MAAAVPHRTIVLLGPQPAQLADKPAIGEARHALAELGVRGKVALVRAGYQEREADDAQTIAALGVPAVNLTLHARSRELFRADREFTTGYNARQQRLKHIQSFYRVRLDKIEDAARTISVRYVEPELLDQEEKVSVDQFRHLDADHMERCAALHASFEQRWQPGERAECARHRNEIRALLADCEAVVIAGGHVASLLNRLELFDVIAASAGKPIVAWSAGAMALTERIVLFHDYPPYGSDIAQVLDAGFGLATGLVVLPDPRRRINLGARAGIQAFARRMAPAVCVAMDVGARVVFERGKLANARAARLTTSGDVDDQWTGAPSRVSSPALKKAKK